MPGASEILDGLSAIANQATGIAVAWHIVIALALLGNGLGSRVWSLTLVAVGLLYGWFGVLRLGVFLDVGLVGGAVALAASAFRSPAAGRARQEYRPRARSERAA
jgi:O-antigen ligase